MISYVLTCLWKARTALIIFIILFIHSTVILSSYYGSLSLSLPQFKTRNKHQASITIPFPYWQEDWNNYKNSFQQHCLTIKTIFLEVIVMYNYLLSVSFLTLQRGFESHFLSRLMRSPGCPSRRNWSGAKEKKWTNFSTFLSLSHIFVFGFFPLNPELMITQQNNSA